ncbi:hypothetical protein MMC06_005051 [Schaereria dolodes]|nr:hypothetical protein [Schaereria dolodes]
MASNDPGFAMMPTAEDPQNNDIDPPNVPEDGHPIAPDQFDPRYETSRWEIWAYYAYYIGNNGLTLFNFAPTAFQNLLYQAAGDAEILKFAGKDRTINSIVLLANGISFAIQIVIFLIIGSYAVIAYQTSLTFWTAAFPGLARNTPQLRAKAEEYDAGDISRDEYDFADTMQRSRLSNMAFYIQSLGEIIILAVIVGVLFGVNVNASQANNNWGLSVLIAFATGVWVLLAIPWFVIEKRRPGQPLPPNMNIVLVGFWQLYRALTQIWRLKQSFIYLIGYFLLGDSLNTTVTVIATLQNTVVEYDTLTLTYILLVGIAAQAAGIYSFWYIQRRFHLDTKTMFNAVMIGIILLLPSPSFPDCKSRASIKLTVGNSDGWGMIGIWTQNFGFHHVWEFWVYQTFYGLFVCPWYSYSQIMISEVTPRGREFLFFSLFSIIGKTSSFIGPLVSSAIIDASPHGNNSTPFYFLFGLSLLSFLGLWWFVDLKESRREQEAFLKEERARVGAGGMGDGMREKGGSLVVDG